MATIPQRIWAKGRAYAGRLARLLPSRHNLAAISACWQIAGTANRYRPGHPRKTRLRQFAELARWYVARGEVNTDFQLYGLDLAGHRSRTVLPYRTFRRLRDRANGRGYPGRDMTALLEHKLAFYLLAERLGVATPRVIAQANASGILWLARTTQRRPLTELGSEYLEAILKPNVGINGTGVQLLSVAGGTVSINGKERALEELVSELAQGEWILQERVQQHPQMAATYPLAVNTLRVVTVRPQGELPARVFIARLRLGAGGSVTDNWSREQGGGILISLHPASGQPRAPGMSKTLGAVHRHPDTGAPLQDLDIPFYAQAVDAVCRLHDELRCFHSVGWDVAITPEGPVIIEGNDNWEAQPLFFETNFRETFLSLLPRDGAGAGTPN